MILYDQKLHIFYSPFIKKKGITSGFATKLNGDGRQKNVIVDLLGAQKVRYKKIIIPHQIHSIHIEVVKSDNGKLGKCDGLITSEKDIVLTILTADCSPIIYADAEKGVIGISHQGWKGTLGKLPELMVKQMVENGANLQTIRCVIGPTINDCCYEIFGERKEHFEKKFGSEVFQRTADKAMLNLSKANYINLLNAGIQSQNIDFSPFCTSCDKENFYSYHRDKGIEGEMISFIVQ